MLISTASIVEASVLSAARLISTAIDAGAYCEQARHTRHATDLSLASFQRPLEHVHVKQVGTHARKMRLVVLLDQSTITMCLGKRATNFLRICWSSPTHLAICRKLLQMPLHKCAVNLHQGLLTREFHCQCHEQPLKPWIDHK